MAEEKAANIKLNKKHLSKTAWSALIGKWIFLAVMIVFTVYPIVYTILGSLKTNAELTQGGSFFPEVWHLYKRQCPGRFPEIHVKQCHCQCVGHDAGRDYLLAGRIYSGEKVVCGEKDTTGALHVHDVCVPWLRHTVSDL